MLPLSPYRPLQLRATVACSTLQALGARPGGGEALRTLPSSADGPPGAGLVVARVRVTDGVAELSALAAMLADGVPSLVAVGEVSAALAQLVRDLTAPV